MTSSEIRKVHCFFEQSGTFKNEFIKLGIPAEDYDIQNNFNQTDHIVDLFAEIEKEYDKLTRQDKTRQDKTSVFGRINPCQDLVLAFFPCIYFTGSVNHCLMRLDDLNYRKLSTVEKFQRIIERAENRQKFYKLLYKLCGICEIKGIKLIVENPFANQHYLHQNFLKEPTIVDKNRQLRGDYFVKPTGYWFFNCEPTTGFSYQKPKETKIVNKCKKGVKAGICSEERSLISPDYARNFICDFILGKKQNLEQFQLDL